MCGIAGIVRTKGLEVTAREVKTMTDTIAHRGPDGEGQWITNDANVGLGHRRLSIIDLTNAGSQPMHYMGRYSIVFNGEVYNYIEIKDRLLSSGYRFESDTDTEVIMAAYHAFGSACLTQFDGMFAFAIYDADKRELFCARDRFGEKPFYYSHDEGRFVFGSEMKALWSIGVEKEPNDLAVYNYIVSNRPIGKYRSDTFYEGIHQLMPAHSMTIRIDEIEIVQRQYWRLDTSQKDISSSDAIDRFQFLFQQSVDRRLRSDVAVGSSLSGGLDSSMVVGYMAKHDDLRLHTFSAAFPGHSRDESHYQQMMVDRISTNHYSTSPGIEQSIDDLAKIIHHQESPFGSMSIAIQYDVFRLARLHGVPVLLDGQGADEILAGYSYFTFSYIRELMGRGRLGSAMQLARQAAAKQSKSAGYFLGGAMSKYVPQKVVNRFKKGDQDSAVAILNSDFARKFRAHRAADLEIFPSLNEALHDRSCHYGLDQLLRYSDRNAMAHAIEVRLPFLSHELVEFVLSTPSHHKIRHGWTKWLARKSAEGIVPEDIIWRKEKIAYESPDNFLFENRESTAVGSTVSDAVVGKYFDKKVTIDDPKIFFRKLMVGKVLESG